MPAFNHIEDCVESGLSVGNRPTKNGVYWYARIYWKEEKKSYYQALKIEYEPSKASLKLAKAQARIVYRNWSERRKLNLEPNEVLTLDKITSDFMKQMGDFAEQNEANIAKGNAPRLKVAGANNPITLRRYNEQCSILDNYVQPYFQSSRLWKKNIRSILQRTLLDFPLWIEGQTYLDQRGEERQVSPSIINKSITLIRLIWAYALRKGLVDWIPNIDRPSTDLKGRSRKRLTEAAYTKMVEHMKNNFQTKHKQVGSLGSDYHRDLAYQFYVFTKLIAWSGIRPPSGNTDRTLLRWSDITPTLDSSNLEQDYFLKRTEKTQKLGEAPVKYYIQPMVIKDLIKLQELYRERNISSPEFIFTHTHRSSNNVAKGTVIKSFRRQFDSMLEAIGMPNEKYAPQSQRFSFYSIRGYYLTMRIRYGGMSLDKLADACNTSVAMIKAVYQDWDIEREVENLRRGTPNYG